MMAVFKYFYSVFFFSSRRRHTRLVGDWSSDVCSSDLPCGCETHSPLCPRMEHPSPTAPPFAAAPPAAASDGSCGLILTIARSATPPRNQPRVGAQQCCALGGTYHPDVGFHMGRCTPVRPAPLCKSDHCQLTRTVPPIAITPPILTHFSLPRWRGRWPQAGGVMGGISSISPRSVGANGVRPAHEAGGAWDRTPSGHTPPCPTPGIQLTANR